MMKHVFLALFILSVFINSPVQARAECAGVKQEGVVLLHGIARSHRSMLKIADAMEKVGYKVLNLDYDSRSHSVSKLAASIDASLSEFNNGCISTLHFVTHSMGGLVARAWIEKNKPQNIGRVVMLAPPNQGSEVADLLLHNFVYRWFFGPAGQELDTRHARQDPISFDLGVIAGNSSWSLLASWIIPGEDDGRVSVERTKLQGMKDHIVLPVTHTFIIRNEKVISQALHFLRHGKFMNE